MIGTIVNTAAIVIGSLVGGLARKGLGPRYQEVLFAAMGLAATGLGIYNVCKGMAVSSYPVLFIFSLALGGVVGTFIDIEGRFNRLVDRVSRPKADAVKEASDEASVTADSAARCVAAPAAAVAPQPASGDLARGLSTGIMLFCFGTLSILGPINSALYGDETFLFTNATLDLVTSMVLASSFGVGIAAAGAVLFCWQGAIFLLAQWLAPLLTDPLMAEISIVGGFLIFASGLSILKVRELSVMNLLPALLVPPLWFAIVSLVPAGILPF